MSGIVPRLLACFLLAAAARAAQGAPSAAAFFRPPQFSQVQVSPSGEFVSALVAAGVRQRLWVMHADRSASRFLDVPANVRGYLWGTDERLLLRVGAPGQAPGVAAINRDGSAYRLLIPPARTGGHEGIVILDLLYDQPAHVLVAWDRRQPHAPDVYRLNIFDGSRQLILRNPGRVFAWMTDHAGVVRVAQAWEGDDSGLHYELHYRAGIAAGWERLHRSHPGGPMLLPLAFGADNRHLLVASSIGRDTTAIYRYDPRRRALGEKIFSAPDVDVKRLRLNAAGKVGTVRYQGMKPQMRFLSQAGRRRHEVISARLPGLQVRVVSRSRDGSSAIVLAWSDRVAGRYYLYRAGGNRLEFIGARRPWLDAGGLATMRPVRLSAPDGLMLEGYLTLPPRASKDLPLIVYPHGGPWSRDVWGFDPVVQFFATRGFAVLQLNYRGSTGYGRKLLNAGRGEWGDAILTDLLAGVRWAVEQGYADPERVCILGASFGGYAALMSAAKYPDTYQCAVSLAAVTNLIRQIEGYRLEGDGRAFAEWCDMVGTPREDRVRLVAASPMNYVRAYEVPLLIAHGGRDRRVSAAQSQVFVKGLQAAGKEYEYVEFERAAHGLADPGNRALFYRQALAFIRRAL